MRKGDETKQEILRAAEQLFCQKGYEATSMQEIVQLAGVSKGGIYHHFASKEEIVQQLGCQQAQRAAAQVQEALEQETSDIARLNLLLTAYMPLKMADKAFTAMILPLMASPNGRALALMYLDARQAAFLPMLAEEIAHACQNDTLFTEIRGVETIVLHLLTDAFLDLSALLLSWHQNGVSCDPGALLNVLTRYRRAVEVLLNAPFGSMLLMPLEELEAVAAALLRQL